MRTDRHGSLGFRRLTVAAVIAAACALVVAGVAFAGTITTPTGNPFVVPGDVNGNPLSFEVVATGFTPGHFVFLEQCDGTPSTAHGWDPTLNCDNGASNAPVIADDSGTATFTTPGQHEFDPVKGVQPNGIFACLAPGDPPTDPPLPGGDWTNCQLRVSSNNTAPTGDQAFLTLQLPGTPAPTTTSSSTSSTSTSTSTTSTSTSTSTTSTSTSTSTTSTSTSTTTVPPTTTTTSTSTTTVPTTTTSTSTSTTSTSTTSTSTSTTSTSTSTTSTTVPPTSTSTTTSTSTSTIPTTTSSSTSTSTTTIPTTSTTIPVHDCGNNKDHGDDGHGRDNSNWKFDGHAHPPCPPFCHDDHDDHDNQGDRGRDQSSESFAPTCFGSSDRVVTIHAATISAGMPARSHNTSLPVVLALLTVVAAGAGFVVRPRFRV